MTFVKPEPQRRLSLGQLSLSLFSLFNKHYSKDARLPEQLQRAMAAEAEAAREARAKVMP